MAKGRGHGGGEEFLLLLIVYGCALVVCVLPGDFMLCFGRHLGHNGVEIAGIVFLVLGALVTLGMATFMMIAICSPSNLSYTDNDKRVGTLWTIGLGIAILLLGLIPGIGCGLGLHRGL